MAGLRGGRDKDEYDPLAEAWTQVASTGCLRLLGTLFTETLKEVRPFCACRKTEGLQLSELFSSWLFFLIERLGKPARFMDWCRLPASAMLYFFSCFLSLKITDIYICGSL